MTADQRLASNVAGRHLTGGHIMTFVKLDAEWITTDTEESVLLVPSAHSAICTTPR
jgi:hypothetical protein